MDSEVTPPVFGEVIEFPRPAAPPSAAGRAALGQWEIVAALAAAAPLVAGAFVSTPGAWGWDHLHRAGLAWRIFVLAAIALAALPGSARVLESALDRIGTRARGRSVMAAGIIALLVAAVYAAFPEATRAYGDSLVFLRYHRPESLAVYLRDLADMGVRFREAPGLLLHEILARVTGFDLASCYRITGALAGGIVAFVLVRMAARLTGVPAAVRAAIVWLGLTDGANQLFFGHVEIYALPRLFACVFLARVVASLIDPERHPPRARHLTWALLAVLFHLQAAVLLPTAAAWYGWHAARRRPALERWTGGRAVGIALTVAVAGIAAVYLAVGAATQVSSFYAGGNPTAAQVFLPVTTAFALPPYPSYTLFSAAHLADLFGSLWALSSAAVLLCVVALLPRHRADRGLVVLAPAVVLAFAHDFVLNPAIGYPFDWDLMCVVSPPLLFLAIYLLAKTRPAPRALTPLIVALGLGTVTLFAVNANAGAARHRVQDMALWLHRTYYSGAHYRLNASYAGLRNPGDQIRERQRVFGRLMAQARRPDPEAAMEGSNLGLMLFESGHEREALRVFRAVGTLDPDTPAHWKPLGILEVLTGDRTRGMALLQRFLDVHPGDALAWKTLGDGWLASNRPDEARRCWTSFLRLAPDAPEAAGVRAALAHLGD